MKRTIRGEKYNVEKLVAEAVAAADASELDTDKARNYLLRLGHTAPADDLVVRVARETAILAHLQRATGALFGGQLGKISFDDVDVAVRQVNAYLDRRNAGHRSRWGK